MMSQMIFPMDAADGERRGGGRGLVLLELMLEEITEDASGSMRGDIGDTGRYGSVMAYGRTKNDSR